MDFIFVEGLQVEARVGIYPHERLASQLVEIDLSFGLPNAAAARDDIADTVCYETVTKRIGAALLQQHFNLLETLGEHIVTLMFEEFGVLWVRLSIAKPGVIPNVRRVGVHIEREKTC